jgi:hypothetical protein
MKKSRISQQERKNKIEAMDPTGTQQNLLLVQMADDVKRLIESRNDVMLELASHKATNIEQTALINQQAEKL